MNLMQELKLPPKGSRKPWKALEMEPLQFFTAKNFEDHKLSQTRPVMMVSSLGKSQNTERSQRKKRVSLLYTTL